MCSESSQVDQYTSGDLVSREKSEESHIHIVEMVFRKAVNKLGNLAREIQLFQPIQKVNKYS